MSTYRPGSSGEEVERIRARLNELGFYRGPLDGAFGGATAAAAKAFQQREGLQADKPELMRFAASIQHPLKHTVNEPWRGMFEAWGRTGASRDIQRKSAAKLFKAAQKLALDYGLRSQRAVALMFDIKIQNGSIGDLAKARIFADFSRLPPDLPAAEAETERMKIIAPRRRRQPALGRGRAGAQAVHRQGAGNGARGAL